MKKYLYPLCALALAGCGSNDAPDTRIIQLPAGGEIAETVNGTAVPQSLVEAIAREHGWHLDQPAQRAQALKIVTDLVVLAQAAQRENLFNEEQFRADAETGRLKAVADKALIELQKRTPISDTMLRSEYDTQIARSGKTAYDFSQLLFATEGEALKAESEILAGKPFQDVFDAWRGKAKQARAFTRVRIDQVPAELGKALASLQNGETTKSPVKTEFGWHIVHLDIANPYTPPEFEQVKEGIRRSMQMKIGKERLDKLKEQAKIEYPPGVAPPVAAASAPAATPTAVPRSSVPAAPVAPASGEEKPPSVPAEKKG